MVLSHPSSKSSSTFQSSISNSYSKMHRFAVGVELCRTDLGDHTYTSTSNPDPIFVRDIMHRAVCARSFVAHVRYDAKPEDLANALDIQPADAHALWYLPPCSNNTCTIPTLNHSQSHHTKVSKQEEEEHMRFTPQSILDCESFVDPINDIQTDDANQLPKCWGRQLDPIQYADLYEDSEISAQQSLEEREFAQALAQKLIPLTDSEELFEQQDVITLTEKKTNNIQKRPTGRRCGFACTQLADVELLCQGMAVSKTGRGLYRAARSTRRLEMNRNYFFEMIIIDEHETSNGICIGIASSKMPLKRLVGGDKSSIGLHSSGQIVRRNGEFIPFGKGFTGGDRVGVKVCLNKSNEKEKEMNARLCFFINGEKQGCIEENLIDEDFNMKIHATASLYKTGSKVVFQCCKKDWATNLSTVCEEEDEEISSICEHQH